MSFLSGNFTIFAITTTPFSAPIIAYIAFSNPFRYPFFSIKRNIMRNWIFSTVIAIAGSLGANTSGFVEYNLPESAQNWQVLHEDEEKQNILIGSVTLEGAEFFGAVHSPELAEMPDMANLEEGLQIPFPDQKVKATILESHDNSLLYEWSASDDAAEVIHGWGRIFCSVESGLVTLNYTTGQINQLDALRPIWVETLRSAHPIAPDAAE